MTKNKFSTYGYTFVSVQDKGRVYATCANCGQGIRYVAHFKNDATGEAMFLGSECVANTTPKMKKAFDFAKKMARVEKNREKFLTENPSARVVWDLVNADSEGFQKTQFAQENPFFYQAWRNLKFEGYLNYGQLKMADEYAAKVGA